MFQGGGRAAPAYFLAQITRSTEAFGSDEPPDASMPFAFKNSCTLSADTNTACAAGVVFAGPATTAGFNSAMPANLPSLERGRARKSESWRWRQREIAAAADLCDLRFHAAHGSSAALGLRVGDTRQLDARLRGATFKIERLQPRAP